MNFCECGCGKLPNKDKHFVHGHHARGKGNPNWKGGQTITKGYISIWMPNHHRADARGYVPQHILIFEKVLGKPLPIAIVSHHVNEIKSDNRNNNLVICQDQTYHFLLHKRTKALKVCGDANADYCRFCKKWETGMDKDIRGTAFHKACQAEYDKNRYDSKRGYYAN